MRDIGDDLFEHEIVSRSRLERDRQVGDALDHERQRAFVLNVVQGDFDPGVPAREVFDGGRQHRTRDRRQRRDDDPALLFAGAGCEPSQRALEVAHDLARDGGGVPAVGVSFMERVVRSNSRAPISCSMRWIASLSAG
jgi:hypothetical protein